MENNITSKGKMLAEIWKIILLEMGKCWLKYGKYITRKRENVGWNGKSQAKGERLVLTRKEQQKTGRQGAAKKGLRN